MTPQEKVNAIVSQMDDLAEAATATSEAATDAESPDHYLIAQVGHLTQAVLIHSRTMLLCQAELQPSPCLCCGRPATETVEGHGDFCANCYSNVRKEAMPWQEYINQVAKKLLP